MWCKLWRKCICQHQHTCVVFVHWHIYGSIPARQSNWMPQKIKHIHHGKWFLAYVIHCNNLCLNSQKICFGLKFRIPKNWRKGNGNWIESFALHKWWVSGFIMPIYPRKISIRIKINIKFWIRIITKTLFLITFKYRPIIFNANSYECFGLNIYLAAQLTV